MPRVRLVILGVLLCGNFHPLAAQDRQDLLARNASVQKLASGFLFTEGPAADAEGNIYFSDIPNNRIHRWSIDGELTTFREDSGGANGLYFDAQGNLLACEGGRRRLALIARDGAVSVLADHYHGKKLNSPNDLWIDPRGGVYFTDPRYGNEDDLEQNGFHVYYLPRAGAPLQRVIDNLVKPNGIIGTSDGSRLYVADAGAGRTYAYRIQEDGTLADRQLFCESGSDGMALDERGNLYLTVDAVIVHSPEGTRIATIAIPETPANVTFGGPDGNTLYITARTGLYALAMNVKGQATPSRPVISGDVPVPP